MVLIQWDILQPHYHFNFKNYPSQLYLLERREVLIGSSSDAHLNLVGAAKAAMTDLGEISVAMHETTDDKNIALWRGTRVRKNHTSKRDAFSSKNEGPLGIVKENVEWKQPYKATGKKRL